MEEKYRSQYSSNMTLYVHVTCALDKSNCKKVFIAVRDSLLSASLDGSGFGGF